MPTPPGLRFLFSRPSPDLLLLLLLLLSSQPACSCSAALGSASMQLPTRSTTAHPPFPAPAPAQVPCLLQPAGGATGASRAAAAPAEAGQPLAAVELAHPRVHSIRRGAAAADGPGWAGGCWRDRIWQTGKASGCCTARGGQKQRSLDGRVPVSGSLMSNLCAQRGPCGPTAPGCSKRPDRKAAFLRPAPPGCPAHHWLWLRLPLPTDHTGHRSVSRSASCRGYSCLQLRQRDAACCAKRAAAAACVAAVSLHSVNVPNLSGDACVTMCAGCCRCITPAIKASWSPQLIPPPKQTPPKVRTARGVRSHCTGVLRLNPSVRTC